MDPAMMAMLASIIMPMISGSGNSKGQQGSTYSKAGQQGIDDILRQVKQQGGYQDINQDQNFQQGQDYLQSMFNDPSFFDKFEAPMMRNFNENIVPGLANQFASMGSGGSMGSTAFRNQLGREGSNLQTNMAAQRGQMQQNAIPQLMNYAQAPNNSVNQMYQQGLTPTNNQYQPPDPGFWGNIAPSLFSAGAQGYFNNRGQQNNQQSNPLNGVNTSTYQQQPNRMPGVHSSTY